MDAAEGQVSFWRARIGIDSRVCGSERLFNFVVTSSSLAFIARAMAFLGAFFSASSSCLWPSARRPDAYSITASRVFAGTKAFSVVDASFSRTPFES